MLFDWITFPEDVAGAVTQIVPVLFIAVIFELRFLKRDAESRAEKKGMRYHVQAAFLGFITAEFALMMVLWNDGLEGEAAFGVWLVIVGTVGIMLGTLLHVVRDD